MLAAAGRVVCGDVCDAPLLPKQEERELVQRQRLSHLGRASQQTGQGHSSGLWRTADRRLD
jgi:hypothetical protein